MPAREERVAKGQLPVFTPNADFWGTPLEKCRHRCGFKVMIQYSLGWRASAKHWTTAYSSDLDSLSQEQRILDIDAEVADCVLDLGVAKEDLDGAQVTRRLMDHCRLRATKRVRAIFFRTQTDRDYPLVNKLRILPRAHVVGAIDPAWKGTLADRAATPFEPSQKAGSHVAGDLELDRAPRLLLDHDRTRPDVGSDDRFSDLDLDQVAAAKLAVYCQIEQGAVPDASFPIKKEADSLNLFLRERTLGADLLSCILCGALAADVIVLRVTHVCSPRP